MQLYTTQRLLWVQTSSLQKTQPDAQICIQETVEDFSEHETQEAHEMQEAHEKHA